MTSQESKDKFNKDRDVVDHQAIRKRLRKELKDAATSLTSQENEKTTEEE